MMEKFIIENKKGKTENLIRAFVGLYLAIYCGYFVFTEAAIDKYQTVFYVSAGGFLLALLLFLGNTIWATNKTLLTVSGLQIESRVKKSKFKIDWVQISKVEIGYSSIIFHTEGGRKQRELDFSTLLYKDIMPLKKRIGELCSEKNIMISEI